MPDARVKIDPALGTLPAGCVALKVYREKAGRWVALEREPDDEGGAALPYFAPDEVPMADANAFASWARERWGPGSYRIQFWVDSGGRRKMAGTGRAIAVGAAGKKGKKKIATEKPEAPQTVLEAQLKAVERIRAELEEERREVREKRDRLLEQQIANEREHNRAILELVMHRAAAPAAPAGPSPTEVELKIQLAKIEARQEMAKDIARAQDRERRRQEEEEDDAPDPEDESDVAQLQRFVGLAEKIGILDMIKPHIAGLLGAKGQA